MASIYCIAHVTALLKPSLQFSGIFLLADPVSLETLASKSATASQLDIKDTPLKQEEIGNFSVLWVTKVPS